MTIFTHPLQFSICGNYFCITERAVHWINDKSFIQIEAGFQTDFESIPRILRSLVPKRAISAESAAIHDWLYKTAKITKRFHYVNDVDSRVSRKQADLIFLDAMQRSGIGFVRRQVLYRGVRAGGWLAWNRHRQNDKA